MLHQKPVGEEEAAQATSHLKRQLLIGHHPQAARERQAEKSVCFELLSLLFLRSLGSGLGLARAPSLSFFSSVLASPLRLLDTSEC